MRAVEVLATSNAAIDAVQLEFNIPCYGYSLAERANALAEVLINEPERSCDGENVAAGILERATTELLARMQRASDRGRREDVNEHQARALWNALERDGYNVDGSGRLQSMFPAIVSMPSAYDEVHSLLDQFLFSTSKAHLDEAVQCHGRGNWTAANGQIRTFMESLLDEIAISIDPSASTLATSFNRRQRLATVNPTFLQCSLGEWDNDGRNFTNGVFKRLHANGPHPGISDEEDCTFRLHLVAIFARLLLRRLSART